MVNNICILLFLSFTFIACSGADESTRNSSVNSTGTNNSMVNSSQDEKARIESKYGIQWDFCDCVTKNDSIDKVLKNEKLSDSQIEVLLKRAEIIENKCKLLLTDLKSNKAAERNRHQQKVKDCLEK
ncbi:MAG: hypothetical protein FJX84_01020 [Bacteroidetes bacterium]|nr:hypothetical protein [Bacteroidota bacterium]